MSNVHSKTLMCILGPKFSASLIVLQHSPNSDYATAYISEKSLFDSQQNKKIFFLS
jgi:hypothetical protein